MKHLIDYLLKLNVEIKHKSLYAWAINEIDQLGTVVGRDQIPWHWTMVFKATKCILRDDFKLEPDYDIEGNSQPLKATENQRISMRLNAGTDMKDGRHHWRPRFSMFGTNRGIRSIWLNIECITNPDEQESCTAWGSVSYISESVVDFSEEIEEDHLEFNLLVRPTTFARYADIIRGGAVDEITFDASRVSGFYSDWSPSIIANDVKVLTADAEHVIENLSELEIQPPRLGNVGNCTLRFNRQIVFEKEEKPGAEKDQDRSPPVEVEREAPEMVILADPELKHMLRSVTPTLRSMRAVLWLVTVLLVVIAIRSFWR